jgi:hypothetical protein
VVRSGTWVKQIHESSSSYVITHVSSSSYDNRDLYVVRSGTLVKQEYIDHFGSMRTSDERIEVGFLLCISREGS